MTPPDQDRELYTLELADGTIIASGRDSDFGHVAPDEIVTRYVPEDSARRHWTPGYGAFIDVGPACSHATHWQEMPPPPLPEPEVVER